MPRRAPLSGTVSEHRRRAYVEAGYWDDSTVIQRLDQWATQTPGNVAVVDLDGRRRRTFGELRADSCKAAGLLASYGVTAGDVVAVQLPNWYETVVIGFAVLRLGAVLNPLIPVYGAKELRLMLEASETSVIVTPVEYRSSRYAERVAEALEGSARPVRHLMIPDPHVSPEPLGELLKDVEPVKPGWYADAAAVSELIFTSGTESLPKAILHTEQTTNCGIREWTRFLGLEADDVLWMPMPIGHSTGFNYGVRLGAYFGLKLVLQDRWDPATAVRLCASEGITCTGVSPTHLLDMLKVLNAEPQPLPKLRYFGCAGAPIPVGLVEAAREYGITVLRGYGSTETLCVAKNHPDVPEAKLAGTDGQVLRTLEIELRDDAGQPSPKGHEGEVFVRGPSCCVGFAPVAGQVNSNLSPDGWIRSGDLAVLDDDRFLTIIGRKKEIIIRGGMNVAPREVEELLVQHVQVSNASVVGLPDPRLGEVVCACLVAKPGSTLDAETIVAFLKAKGLASYKLPSRVEFLDVLPTTETGKVKKPELVSRLLRNPVEAEVSA